MPKIAQYEPDQVRSQVVAQPLMQDAPRGAFGGQIAKGVSDVVSAGLQMKQRIDITSSEEALVQFERDKNDVFFNPDTGYFNSQGRDAYDKSADTTKLIEKLKMKYGETLNAESKQLFDRAADAHITRSKADIARHASKGLKAWEVSTIEAQVENSLENASLYWNDPDRLKVQNVLGRQAVIDSSDMLGLSPEAKAEKLQTFESAFASSTVVAAIQSSADEGKAAFDKYSARLEGPDKVKLEAAIEKKVATEKIKSDAIAAVLTANKLVDQYENRSDIVKEVNKIKDVELRKKTMAESMSQYSRKKQAESEFRGDSFEDAESHIIDGGSAEEFRARNPEGWESLSRKQQSSIESGKSTVTNWNVFSDLILLPKAKLAQIDPTDYFHHLAKAERNKLISAVKSASGKGSSSDKIDHQVGRTRSAQTTSAVEQMFGKKKSWNDDERDQVNAFYSMLDDEVKFRESEKDAKLTSDEFTGVLSDLTRVVVQEGIFFDTELNLTDVPAEHVPVLSRFLRDNNIPVTADNLIKAYKQASD